MHTYTDYMYIYIYVCVSLSFCSLSEMGQALTTLTSNQTTFLREYTPDRYYPFRSEVNFNIYPQINLDDRWTVLSMNNN